MAAQTGLEYTIHRTDYLNLCTGLYEAPREGLLRQQTNASEGYQALRVAFSPLYGTSAGL